MSELDKLKDMRSFVPPPTTESLRISRARMLSGARPPFRLPDLIWKASLAGGLAIALLAGASGLAGLETRRPDGTPIQHGQVAEAAVVLEQAAVTVQDDEPQQRPRDDQFIYTKSLRKGYQPDGEVETVEKWTPFSYDKGVDKDNRSPRDIWEYNESLPNDPDKALKEIYAEVRRIYRDTPDTIKGDLLHERAFWLCGVILGSDEGLPAQPKQQATLYRAIAKIPGVKVKTDVEDLAGRQGTMIYRDSKGGAGTLGFILSPKTYEYLGREQASEWEGDTPVLLDALLEKKVVDKRGKDTQLVVRSVEGEGKNN